MTYTITQFPFTDRAYESVLRLRNQLHPDNPSSPVIWRYWDGARDAGAIFDRLLATNETGLVVAYGQVEAASPGGAHLIIAIEMPSRLWLAELPDELYRRLTSANTGRDPIRVTIRAREDEQAKLAFLRHHGFELVLRSPVFHLDVRAFDATPYDPMVDQLRRAGVAFSRPPQGWQHDQSWQSRIFNLYWTLLQDTPHYEPREKPALARFVEAELDHPNFLPGGTFLACDGDRLVGLSSLVKRGGATEVPGVGLTGVLHSHRRRGLATVLKVQAIQFAQSLCARLIVTDNEESNPMHLLNQRLGFVRRPAWTHWQKVIS